MQSELFPGNFLLESCARRVFFVLPVIELENCESMTGSNCVSQHMWKARLLQEAGWGEKEKKKEREREKERERGRPAIPRSTEPLHFFFFLINFIYLLLSLFFFGCVGSSFLCEGFLQLRRAGATPHCGARASHYCCLSRCGAQAPAAQAQQLWLTGPVAPRHAGSSQTRARTRVPRTGRRTPNHCATREAPLALFEV